MCLNIVHTCRLGLTMIRGQPDQLNQSTLTPPPSVFPGGPQRFLRQGDGGRLFFHLSGRRLQQAGAHIFTSSYTYSCIHIYIYICIYICIYRHRVIPIYIYLYMGKVTEDASSSTFIGGAFSKLVRIFSLSLSMYICIHIYRSGDPD